jgi:hypothetical protein
MMKNILARKPTSKQQASRREAIKNLLNEKIPSFHSRRIFRPKLRRYS